MRKKGFAALIAAAMIGAVFHPAMTAFAAELDFQDTASSETMETETAAPEAETEEEAESIDENMEIKIDPVTGETKPDEEAAIQAGSEEVLAFLNEGLPGISGMDLGFYTDIHSDLDLEAVEIFLKNPKLLACFLPTLHVTVTESSVTIAIDGKDQEGYPETGKVRTKGSNLNVRSGPGIDYETINKLANGTEVQISREENGWYQLVFPAKYGYVCGKYLELSETEPKEIPEGYTFDINGETMACFLSLFSGLFEEGPETAVDAHGLTPPGNLSLVDDIGPVNGEGQQFVTLVSKTGNVFYLIIDRDEKGEENVHFLNLVDERDLLTLMEEDEQAAYQEQLAAEAAAKEAAEKAAAETAAETEDEREQKDKSRGNRLNLLPLLLVAVVLIGAAAGWVYLKAKKKKQAIQTPDPDADYSDDEDEEDYGAGEEGDVSEESADPYPEDFTRDDPEEM